MSTSGSDATFSIERYRTQWGHLPLAFLPFLCAFGLVVVLKLLEPAIGEEVASAVLSAVGIGFAAFVLTLPWTWKRWRARGRLELRLAHGELRLVDPSSGAIVGRCRSTPESVLPAEFQYTVNSRFAGGTFRAPAMIFRCEGRAAIAVGVQGSRLTWRGAVEPVARPDYLMGAAEWETFVEMIGMSERLTFVTDARVR
jgi:hypothetical protein